MTEIGYKQCGTCKESKLLSEFHKRGRAGHRWECKSCTNVRLRERRTKAHEYVANYLKGKCCEFCRNANPIVLQFDHVRGTKKDTISNMMNSRTCVDTIQKEIDKCIIVCANCHLIRHSIERGWKK